MIAEACIVCLEDQGHAPGVSLEMCGISSPQVHVHWQTASKDVQDTYADHEVATECGAIAVAALAVQAFTDYTIIRRSMKGTGFDYWLSRKGARPFRDDARLEVSGIRVGSRRQLRTRARQKARQTDRSDGALPAFIAVIEFSLPLTLLQRKEDL